MAAPVPSQAGADIFAKLAEEVGALPNVVVIEGHTDAKPFNGFREYSNWELSADRANAARRIMMSHGLRPDQVAQVRGYADQHLRKPRRSRGSFQSPHIDPGEARGTGGAGRS